MHAEPRQPVDQQEAQRRHEALLEELTRHGLLSDPAIAAAFRAVLRHHFLPALPLEQVYRDRAITTKQQGDEPLSSSSQPTMMAIMLHQLALTPGQRVLEIGAGTGYNAALLATLVGPSGHVTSIDIDRDLIEAAQTHLEAAGVSGVELRCSDGALGAPDRAPFDRILVTVGAWDLLPAWREQLAPNGRIVLPMTLLPAMMLSLALERQANGWQAVSARPCGFVLMRGAEAHPSRAWGTPRIRVHPRAERTDATQARAAVEKEWSTIEISWE